jgi:hypothetical protein
MQEEIGVKYPGRYTFAPTFTNDHPLPHEIAKVDAIAPGMSATPVRPPVFYQNKLGVVTNRRQFRSFYHYELVSGRPLGPHFFARY